MKNVFGSYVVVRMTLFWNTNSSFLCIHEHPAVETHFFPPGAATASISQHLLEYMPNIMKMILYIVSVSLYYYNKLYQILAT